MYKDRRRTELLHSRNSNEVLSGGFKYEENGALKRVSGNCGEQGRERV